MVLNLTGIRYTTFPTPRVVVTYHEHVTSGFKMEVKVLFDNKVHNLTKG